MKLSTQAVDDDERTASVAHDRRLDCRGRRRGRRDRRAARRRADDGGQPDQQPAVRSAPRTRWTQAFPPTAGAAVTDIVVVRSPRYTVDAPQFRALVRGLASDVRRAGGVDSVRTYLDARDPSLVSKDRHATMVQFAEASDDGIDDDRRRGRARRREPGVRRLGHRPEDARPRLQRALAERPAARRAPVRPAGRADHPAARLRGGRRRARPAADHAALDRGRARPRRRPRARVQPLGLRDQHADRDGARARDRLRAVRRLALPRGARPGPREARRDRRVGDDREPGGGLQRDDVRDRDVRDADRAELDHAQPRGGRDRRRDRLGRRLGDAAAGAARRCSATASTGCGSRSSAGARSRPPIPRAASGARSCARCCDGPG